MPSGDSPEHVGAEQRSRAALGRVGVLEERLVCWPVRSGQGGDAERYIREEQPLEGDDWRFAPYPSGAK